MEAIEYMAPKTLEEALQAFASKGDRARGMAGGTDILVQLRGGRRSADLIVDLKNIPELNELSYDSQKGLTIGAAVPCTRIYEDQKVASAYPGLTDAASLIGSVQIQGRASLGGNICNSAPSADAIPPVIVLGGVCNIAGPNGTRQVAAEDFCTGPGQNVLQTGEILVSVSLPPPQAHSGANYLRFIPRNEMDIAVVGVGTSVVLDASGQNFVSARIALASVAPRSTSYGVSERSCLLHLPPCLSRDREGFSQRISGPRVIRCQSEPGPDCSQIIDGRWCSSF